LKINPITGKLPKVMSTWDYQELAQALAAVGSPERLRIVGLLLREPKVGCGRIADYLELSRPAVSYHLRVLETSGLIEKQREGRRRCIVLTSKLERILGEEIIAWLKGGA